MLAALLTTYLILSGGGGFAARLFGKDTQAAVRQIVSDPARAEAASQILKQGLKDLETSGKQFDRIAKAFSKADEAQAAGLEELAPLMKQASEERRAVQGKSLDRLFDLRKNLTEEEWGRLLATLK